MKNERNKKASIFFVVILALIALGMGGYQFLRHQNTASGEPAGTITEQNTASTELTDTITEQNTISGSQGASEGGASDLKVTVLNVGQGLSILIENGGHKMLYDGGDAGAASYVLNYLKDHQATDLDYVVASHYDTDHISGLIDVVNQCTIGQFMGPSYDRGSDTYDTLMNTLKEKDLKVHTPTVGDTFNLGEVSIQVVAPNSSQYNNSDCYSIALVLRYQNNSLFLPGDAPKESIKEILAAGWDIKADVYVVGHHGNKDGTTKKYLQAISPKYSIVSCDGKSKNHPSQKAMNLLEQDGCDLFRTDLQGDIVVTCNGTDYEFNVQPTNDYNGGE